MCWSTIESKSIDIFILHGLQAEIALPRKKSSGKINHNYTWTTKLRVYMTSVLNSNEPIQTAYYFGPYTYIHNVID